jgi:hypothetical protein
MPFHFTRATGPVRIRWLNYYNSSTDTKYSNDW